MAWALLLTNASVVLLVVRLRYDGGGLEHASPVPMGPQAWWWAAAGAAALALVAAAVAARRPRPGRARATAELLAVFVPMFAFEWGVLPPYHWRAVDWTIMAGLAILVAALFWLDRRNAGLWGVTGRNFASAARLLAIPTTVFVAVPAVAAIFVGTDCRPGQAALDLIGYPFYALTQLLLFQVFLVRRLTLLADSRTSTVLVSAGMFALLHWPNGIVMAASGAGAVVWTAVYLRRPNVYALALSMGLAVVALANLLPRDLTHNLRTGPTYVQRLIDARTRPRPEASRDRKGAADWERAATGREWRIGSEPRPEGSGASAHRS
jgi:hypothetical protein